MQMSREMMLTIPGQATARAYLALPPSGTGPALLVLHPWWGLNDDIRGFCDNLAAEGFVALAPDCFAGQVATTIDAANHLVQTADDAACMRIVSVALDELLHLDAVSSAVAGVVGFSFGAHFSLATAGSRPDDIDAVVIYYGTSDADLSAARARFLGHFAEDDPYEDAGWVQQVEATIRATGNPVTFHTYPNTGHWFVEPGVPEAYNAAAAGLAWERTLAFLRRPPAIE